MMESLFDAQESLARKDLGMQLAAEAREDMLSVARGLAVYLGQVCGEVNMDMVNRELELRGMDYRDLGPAAGSVFKGKEWKFTGRRVRSQLITNHGREIKVWKYIGG